MDGHVATGLVVLGSNAEAAQLDDDECDRVVDLVREHVPSDRPLIAGTGRESASDDRGNAARGVGRRRRGARPDAVILQVADDGGRFYAALHLTLQSRRPFLCSTT